MRWTPPELDFMLTLFRECEHVLCTSMLTNTAQYMLQGLLYSSDCHFYKPKGLLPQVHWHIQFLAINPIHKITMQLHSWKMSRGARNKTSQTGFKYSFIWIKIIPKRKYRQTVIFALKMSKTVILLLEALWACSLGLSVSVNFAFDSPTPIYQ